MANPISYRLHEIASGEVLQTQPATVENYLAIMEANWHEAARLERIDRSPENVGRRYLDSLREEHNEAVEALDRLGGSIPVIRQAVAAGNWREALIAMYDAADSHRRLLDNPYVAKLRDTSKATAKRKQQEIDRRKRLSDRIKYHGAPPAKRTRARTDWIKQFLAADAKPVAIRTIRADLDFLGY